jgi:uncharacterized protein
MEWDKLHLIKNNNSNLAFYYPTYDLIEINNTVYSILARIKAGSNLSEIAVDFNRSENELTNFLNKFTDKFVVENTAKKVAENKDASRKINRITLHISNDCNLRCKYCYADGGSYNLSRNLMSIETAQSFIDFCAQHFDSIGTIAFFGGEPLMNIDVMEYICDTMSEHTEQGKIKQRPDFGIITNGTIINGRLIALVKKYISFITVSIDGPKAVNDANRVYPNGRGSYDKIENFIKTLKKETNVHMSYEATYTDYHIKEKVSKEDLDIFFLNEFGINGVVVDEYSLNDSVRQDLDPIEENFDIFSRKDFFSTFDLRSFPEGFWRILSSVVYKHQTKMCLIAKDIVAVSAEGDIYPCHMNTGKQHLCLGNISTSNIYNSPNEYKKEFSLVFNINNREILCKDCWAQNICGGCTMRWFYDESLDNYIMKPNTSLCLSNKRYLEKILSLIAHIRTNSQKWESFVEHINNNSSAQY